MFIVQCSFLCFVCVEFERFVRFQEEWRKRLAVSEEEKEELMARCEHKTASS